MPQSYHTGHIRMRTSDLTDTEYIWREEGSGERRQRLNSHVHFCYFRALLQKKQSQRLINLRLFLWVPPRTSRRSACLFLCHLSPVSTHVMCIPSQLWLRWFSRADARPGVFSHSPSLVAVTQEALSFHYPAFPPRLLSQTEVYGNTAAESSPGLGFMNQWNMLQTLHPATPFPGSTLAYAHNSVLSSYARQRRRGLRLMGMYWLVRNLVKRMLLLLCHCDMNKHGRMCRSTWFKGCLSLGFPAQCSCQQTVQVTHTHKKKLFHDLVKNKLLVKFLVNRDSETKWSTSSKKGQICFSCSDSRMFSLRVDRSFTTSGRESCHNLAPTTTSFWHTDLPLMLKSSKFKMNYFS